MLYTAHEGTVEGPLTPGEVRRRLESGRLTRADHFSHAHTPDDWLPMDDFELATTAPAPLPAMPAPSRPHVYRHPVVRTHHRTLDEPARSRLVYILLALFLGLIGIHNFYAGYTGRAIAQIAFTVCTAGIVTAVWILVDIVCTTQDATGERMA